MPSATEFGSLRHLSVRFFTALSPSGPSASDESWALSNLLPGERVLWERMSGPDRRHAVGVARRTVRLLGPEVAGRQVVAAALLHDVGKVDARFGTISRAGITASAIVLGRPRLLRWAGDSTAPDGRGRRGRVGVYLNHDCVGAVLLETAGSASLTSSWARDHHKAPEDWTIDRTIATALKEADGD